MDRGEFMLRRMLFALIGAVLLTACGRGSEDFTVKIAREPSRVAAALGQISLDEKMAALFPGLKVERSTPAEGQLFYDVPGDAEFRAAVHFTLEPVDGGKATIVHAAIDVPEVKVTIDTKTKVISETKVEFGMREIVQKIGTKLEQGGDIASEREKMSQLLTVLAIVTDTHNLALAVDMENNPEWYLAGLDWLGGGNDVDYPDSPYGDPAQPDDPGAAARQQDYRDKDAAQEAAAPMDQPAGDDARGDYAGPEE